MTMHFAEVAFALLAGGAAVLIVAGLVLEALHDKTRPTAPFDDGANSAGRAVNIDTMRQKPNKGTGNEHPDARLQSEKRQANLSDEERRTKREERKRRRAAKRSQAAVQADANGD